jgi:DNA-binding MarR family transcriptional regulator
MMLESIYHYPSEKPVRQRDLARIVGISLGMTNVILKKLAQKGWVIARKISSRNVQYVVTPSGIEEIARRSFKFIKRTVRNVVYYKDILEVYLTNVRAEGYRGILLVGKSDFDFILAHLCETIGLEFVNEESPENMTGMKPVFSEDTRYPPKTDRPGDGEAGASLHDILIGL